MLEKTFFTDDERDAAIEQMNHFLAAILGEDDLHEIRPVPFAPPGSLWGHPRDFASAVPQLMAWNAAGVNPYFSLNPRRATGCTKGADSLPGFVLVADDDKAISLEALKARNRERGLPPPTAIVSTSPDHWHSHWRLEERLPDLATFKRHQRAIAETLGTCQAVTSFQQVMRLPGPFCNVKPDRPTRPRVVLVECDPNRRYPASCFPIADPEPEYQAVPLEQLAMVIEKGSLSDASRALVERRELFKGKGRRQSLFAAARDMHARGWTAADAEAVLVETGKKLELEPDDLADFARQVKNAFASPASPGYAAAETATITFTASSSKPTAEAEGDDDYLAELEALPLPEPPKPPSMPEAYLHHGLHGRFIDRVGEETEAHPVPLLATLDVSLGNAIGRGPFTMVGRSAHRLNLFLAIVGNTSAGRKGTSADIIADCIRPAEEYWATACQSPNLTSGEGLIDALRDRVSKMAPVKGKPDQFEEVVIDPGVQDKRLLITCSELASALKAGNREGSILLQTLRELWDGKTVRTLAKTCPRIATDPHLSIIAHVTRGELLRVLKSTEHFGGGTNRFVWVLSERVRELPHGGDLDDLGTIPQRIGDCIAKARTVGRMRRSAAADRLWEESYSWLTNPRGSDLLVAVLSRAEAQVLRWSMLMAIVAGRDTIEADDLAAALDFWRYAEASAKLVFGGVEDGLFERVREAIEAEPGITRSKLHKRLGWRLPSSQLVEVLGRVRASGVARMELKQTAGKAAERWWPAAASAGGGCERGDWGEKGPPPDPYRPNRPQRPAAPAESIVWNPDNLAPGRYSV
jgi:hypothetical protein